MNKSTISLVGTGLLVLFLTILFFMRPSCPPTVHAYVEEMYIDLADGRLSDANDMVQRIETMQAMLRTLSGPVAADFEKIMQASMLATPADSRARCEVFLKKW